MMSSTFHNQKINFIHKSFESTRERFINPILNKVQPTKKIINLEFNWNTDFTNKPMIKSFPCNKSTIPTKNQLNKSSSNSFGNGSSK